MKIRELDGDFELTPVQNFPVVAEGVSVWHKMSLPSHWQQLPEMGEHVGKVVYRKSFSFKKKKAAHYRLVLPGIFYWSTVFLNGEKLGSHEGYFTPQSYEITSLLKGENELVIHVDCPDEKEKNGKRMLTGVFSHWDCLDPKANPGGIWLAPEIHESFGVFVDRALFHTETIGENNARVRLKLDLTAIEEQDLRALVTYEGDTFESKPQSFEHEFHLPAGHTRMEFAHELADPTLWWPHDLGKPDLYKVTVALLPAKGKKALDTWEDQFGVRTVEVRNWIFYVNGQRHYIKGNNYAPSDTRIATTTRELVEKDLQLAIDCNLNLLRVHAHIDHPEFYKAADRMGVMLWQDFSLQWSYAREVLPIAKEQIAGMVRLLYNHPSVVTWCCHNEAIYLVDTKDEDLANISKSVFSIFVWSWNRDVMDVELQKTVESEDSSRFCNRSSGEPAVFKKGADTHFYFGWYRVQGPKRAFDKVAKFTPKNLRFVTEFGAQSFPSYESSVKFMDEDITKIDWQKLGERNSLQIDLMEHWVGLKRADLKELIDASQEYQTRINQYYIDRIRRLKYNPGGGCVPFMFNDPNPAIQWSIVDYWRVPKSSYFTMKRFMSDQYAFVLLDKDVYAPGTTLSIPLFCVNDAKKAFSEVRLDMTLTNPQSETVLSRGFVFDLPSDCPAQEVARLQQTLGGTGTYCLKLRLTHSEFEMDNDYLFDVR